MFFHITFLGVEKRVDRTTKIIILGIIIGAFLFLGFYITSFYGYHLIGIPLLEEFIAMCGIILFIISGFFLVSLRTAGH